MTTASTVAPDGVKQVVEVPLLGGADRLTVGPAFDALDGQETAPVRGAGQSGVDRQPCNGPQRLALNAALRVELGVEIAVGLRGRGDRRRRAARVRAQSALSSNCGSGAVVFLASDDALYVSGSNVLVDGGAYPGTY